MHITIGSDPEFCIATLDGRPVPADRFYEFEGEIGTDGRTDTGELRPPAGDTTEHLMQIKRLIGLFHEEHPDHMMLAGSRHFKAPLGGHIHFSGPGVASESQIASALDLHLAVPILMLENRLSAKERRAKSYGALSDVRDRKFHGGWEYRTLPSWLVSYKMAKTVLEIATLIAYDYTRLYHNGHLFQSMNEISDYFRYAEKERIYRTALESVNRLKVLPNANQVMNSILTLENCIFMKLQWGQEIDACSRWFLKKSFTLPKLKMAPRITYEPAIAIISSEDSGCNNIVEELRNLLRNDVMYDQYYIYGILDRYGYDFAVSKPFDVYNASVSTLNIKQGWYGRAAERAPNAILIGVSGFMRQPAQDSIVKSNLLRIIRELERE